MMAATAAWEGTGLPQDEPQNPPGRSVQPPQGASAGTLPTLHDSAQSTAKDSPATGSGSKKDSCSTLRVTVNLPVSTTPTGTKLAVTSRSESPAAGGEGFKVEPKSLDQEKEIALSQLQELEEAIKVRKDTKVDGRKIRWIEYRARKKQEEQEKATPTKKKGRRSKGVENSENDSSIVNNNNNNKSETMKVEVVTQPLSVVGRSNVLESMKQQFLQGTENVGEPIANGKTDNQTETPETNQKRKSGRTRKSLNTQKGATPKGNTPKNATPKNLTLKESNGKGVNRRNSTPKGAAAKAAQKASVNTPDNSATNSPVLTSTPTSTSPPVTPQSADQPLSSSLKKPFFPARSLTKGLREVRKAENGESPKKGDDQNSVTASSPITPMAIATSTPILTQPKTEPVSKCPLIAVAARLLSPPSARSKSLDNTKSKKAGGRNKKASGKGVERSESEPRSLMNGHTRVQNGPLEDKDISANDSLSEVEEKHVELTGETAQVESSEISKDSLDEKSFEVKEEEVEPNSTLEDESGLESEFDNTMSRRGRGRPPKRKFGAAAKEPDAAGKSSKKLSTVVVDVHNTMNGEPQTVVSTPKSRKKTPVKKYTKAIVLPGGTDDLDTKDSTPTGKQAKLSDVSHDSDVEVKEQTATPAGIETKKSKANAGKKQTVLTTNSEVTDDTSASMSNQTPLTLHNTLSTKLVKGVQKLTNQEVPSETETVNAPSVDSELDESLNKTQDISLQAQDEVNKLDSQTYSEEVMVTDTSAVMDTVHTPQQKLPAEKGKNSGNAKTPVGKTKKAAKSQAKKSSPLQKVSAAPKGLVKQKKSPAKKKASPVKKTKASPKNPQAPKTPKQRLLKEVLPMESFESPVNDPPVEKAAEVEIESNKSVEEVVKEEEVLIEDQIEDIVKEDVEPPKEPEVEAMDESQVNNLTEVEKEENTEESNKELKEVEEVISHKEEPMEEELIKPQDLEDQKEDLLKENNNLPTKEPEVQTLSNVQENASDVKETEDKAVEVHENSQVVLAEEGESLPSEQTQEIVLPKENGNITSPDIEVIPSTTSISPETSASGGKSKEKVPRILKQLLQDEGVQNMLKSMGDESVTAPEGSPSESSVHKLRPKRASEPMLSSSPELDVLEALLSPTTKKKKQRSELDTLYMDEGVLNLLTSLEPYSRRQPHQDDAASDISQASSAKSVKITKTSKSALDVQNEGRKRKLSGASTVSNTSTRSMQPPESKKPRLENQETPVEDPYELDTAEEFKETPVTPEATNAENVAQPVKKRGRPTLPLSVKQKNKAIRMQLKLQKQKQQKVNTVVGALLKEDDNMNLAQLKDVLSRASKAFNQPYREETTVETPIDKAVPPLKIKLASESVTIRQIPRPGSAQGHISSVSPSGERIDTNVIKPPPKQVTASATFNRPSVKPGLEARISPKSIAERPKPYPERRTPPPQQRRFEGITSPTAASFSSLVKTLESSGQNKSRQRTGGESIRQSQRASVRQSEGSYHYRDISLRKFNNFTQIILSPSTTKMKNALNSRVLRELCEALNILKRDDSVRMVLLTATGSTFCQGVDLTALQHPNLETRKKNAENLVRGIKDFLKVLVQFPKPIVAGVNGNAMGLGVTMLPLFDMVIANDKAEFYLPYAKLGQVPEGGATYTFPNLFGKLPSTQLFLGHKVTAAKAQEMGLASESIWPATYQQELIPKVALLASQSAQSMEATKALMNHHLVTKLELSLESECRLLLQQWTSPHFAHHCKRFLESHHVQLQKPVNLPL